MDDKEQKKYDDNYVIQDHIIYKTHNNKQYTYIDRKPSSVVDIEPLDSFRVAANPRDLEM